MSMLICTSTFKVGYIWVMNEHELTNVHTYCMYVFGLKEKKKKKSNMWREHFTFSLLVIMPNKWQQHQTNLLHPRQCFFFFGLPLCHTELKTNWWHVERCDLHTRVAVHKRSQPTCPERLWLSRCAQPTPPTALWTSSTSSSPKTLTHWPTGGKRGRRASQSPLLERQMAIFFPKHSKKEQTYIKLALLGMLVLERSVENKGIKHDLQYVLHFKITRANVWIWNRDESL